MKTLDNYIRESLLSDEGELIGDDNSLIEQFLKDNYRLNGRYSIKNNIVDVDGTVQLITYPKHLTNGIFHFGIVKGDFFCGESDIIDLIGSPEEVKGDFICTESYDLATLEGGPKKVDGSFICALTDIKDLQGAPDVVGENFDCSDCSKLKSLKGLPKKIGGSLYYENTPIFDDKSIKNELKRKKIKYYEIGLPF